MTVTGSVPVTSIVSQGLISIPFNFLLTTGQSALTNFAGDRELLILLNSILPYIAVLSHTLSTHIFVCLPQAIAVICPFISIAQLFLSHIIY